MAENESYKKTVLEVTVLSEGNWDWETLGGVAYDITNGDCSGDIEVKEAVFLSEEQTARELVKQGSDPAFLLGEKWEGWEPPADTSSAFEPSRRLGSAKRLLRWVVPNLQAHPYPYLRSNSPMKSTRACTPASGIAL